MLPVFYFGFPVLLLEVVAVEDEEEDVVVGGPFLIKFNFEPNKTTGIPLPKAARAEDGRIRPNTGAIFL